MLIKLKSSDDIIFSVDLKAAQKSVTIKTMLETLGFTEEDEKEPIPLPNVNSSILKMVIEWCDHHKNDPSFFDDDWPEETYDDMFKWDKEFFNVEKKVLFDLILAANYLDIKGLLEGGCKTVANLIKDKTPDEIRKSLNLNEKVSAEGEQ